MILRVKPFHAPLPSSFRLSPHIPILLPRLEAAPEILLRATSLVPYFKLLGSRDCESQSRTKILDTRFITQNVIEIVSLNFYRIFASVQATAWGPS